MMQFRDICWIFKMILLIVLCLASYSLCEESPKYPENTADIASINNLAYKSPIALDPKIRKALLNVLSRLEEQDKTEIDIRSNAENHSQQQQQQSSDDEKSEDKTNDNFKEYNYYEIVQETPSSTPESVSRPEEHPDKESTSDEPGALFFQTPHDQQESSGKEKHESLNGQETKNALNSDTIFSHLENEIRNEQKNEKTSNDTKSAKGQVIEDDVELFRAPLLTAFTLEQDERGLPRRIIPLDTAELSSILDNKIIIDPTQETRKAREQHSRTLDKQKITQNFETSHITRSIENPVLLQNEQKRYQLNLESQLIELQEQKRQLDLEKKRFLIEQEKQKLLIEQENARRLKLSLELRERENILRAMKQNEIPRQEIALQKSIPLEIYNKPVFVQPIPIVHYKPQFEFPETVDRQLQNLFQKSGITQGKHEDLNIVSKVLALNYDEDERPKPSPEQFVSVREGFKNQRRPNAKDMTAVLKN